MLVTGNADAGAVMDGRTFRQRVLDDSGNIVQSEFDRVWPPLRVLARCSPSDKLTIVQGPVQFKFAHVETKQIVNRLCFILTVWFSEEGSHTTCPKGPERSQAWLVSWFFDCFKVHFSSISCYIADSTSLFIDLRVKICSLSLLHIEQGLVVKADVTLQACRVILRSASAWLETGQTTLQPWKLLMWASPWTMEPALPRKLPIYCCWTATCSPSSSLCCGVVTFTLASPNSCSFRCSMPTTQGRHPRVLSKAADPHAQFHYKTAERQPYLDHGVYVEYAGLREQ